MIVISFEATYRTNVAEHYDRIEETACFNFPTCYLTFYDEIHLFLPP